MNLIKVIKALADENRLRILNLLNHKELCVCEMENILGMTQSNVSRHLIKLKDAELIESEKQGQFVFHKVNPGVLEQFPFVQNLLIQELIKMKKSKDDLNKLKTMNDQGMLCEREICCKK
jgi:ArsR family transcriptional regulator, arsenate/arsenite/antimonite-responsive transcriptional repressor